VPGEMENVPGDRPSVPDEMGYRAHFLVILAFGLPKYLYYFLHRYGHGYRLGLGYGGALWCSG